MRNASADRNRADVHVAIVDVPAFLAGIGRSAAGQDGHAPLKRCPERQANCPKGWAQKGASHCRSRVSKSGLRSRRAIQQGALT